MSYAKYGKHHYGYKYFVERRFSVNQIPDLSGKTAIVTGGTSGIGLETATQLAARNAEVIILGSSDNRGKTAVDRIQKETGRSVRWVYLNLNSIAASKAAAQAVQGLVKKLDILVANAGIGNGTGMSDDGFESVFACNHLGHFAFVTALVDLFTGKDVRVVVLSSVLHYKASSISYHRLSDKPNTVSKQYGDLFKDGQRRYKESKLANLLFSRALARRVGENVYVNAVHPGMIQTSIQSNLDADMKSFGIFAKFAMFIINLIFITFGITISDGALTQLYCATAPEIREKGYRGEYFVPIAVRDRSSEAAEDLRQQEELWAWSAKIVGSV